MGGKFYDHPGGENTNNSVVYQADIRYTVLILKINQVSPSFVQLRKKLLTSLILEWQILSPFFPLNEIEMVHFPKRRNANT